MRRYIVGALIFLFGAFSSLIVSYGSKPRQFVPKIAEVTKEATSTSMLDAKKNGELVLVTRVIDGDTIELADGKKVRYIGIDSPEIGDTRKEVECFTNEATEENRRLVEGKTVRLEKDVSETDRYGRFLRYIYVDKVFVNDYLVRQGFARVDTFPPDVAHREQFLEAQGEAREQGRGLWGRNGCFLDRHVSGK